MAGLFSTPEQVLERERLARSGGFDPRQAALFEVGFQSGNAAIRGLGGQDPQSSELLQALELQEDLQGVDFRDRDAVLDLANLFAQEGHINEAILIKSMAPELADLSGVGEDETRELTIENDDGTFNKQKVLGRPVFNERGVEVSFEKLADVDTNRFSPGAGSNGRNPKDKLISQGERERREIDVIDPDSLNVSRAGKIGRPEIYETPDGVQYEVFVPDVAAKAGEGFRENEPTPDPIAKLNETFNRDIRFDQDARDSVLNQLTNFKELNGRFSQPEPEEVAAHGGGILDLAERIRQREANVAKIEFAQNIADGVSHQTARQILEFTDATNARQVVQQATDLYRQSGLMAANSTDSFMGAEEAAITKTGSLEDLEARAQVNKEKGEILAKKEEAEGGMHQADPNGPGFRVDTVDQETAELAFTNVGTFDNDALKEIFRTRLGSTFDNERSEEWHTSNWDRMRATESNQQFVKDWFPGTIRQRAKLTHDLSKQAWNDVELDQWADYQLMHKYLSNLQGKRKAEQDAVQKVLDQLALETI